MESYQILKARDGLPQMKERKGLLDLPPEIWSYICKLTVTENRPVFLGLRAKRNVTQPPITQVCRAIREECLPHYYRTNVFYASFCGLENVLRVVARWVDAIGAANRGNLRRVYIRLARPMDHDSPTWPASVILSQYSDAWAAQQGKIEDEDLKFLQRSGYTYEGGYAGTPLQRIEIITCLPRQQSASHLSTGEKDQNRRSNGLQGLIKRGMGMLPWKSNRN